MCIIFGLRVKSSRRKLDNPYNMPKVSIGLPITHIRMDMLRIYFPITLIRHKPYQNHVKKGIKGVKWIEPVVHSFGSSKEEMEAHIQQWSQLRVKQPKEKSK